MAPTTRRTRRVANVPLREQLTTSWDLLNKRQREEIGHAKLDVDDLPLIFGADPHLVLSILQELDVLMSLIITNTGVTYMIKQEARSKPLDESKVQAVLEGYARRIASSDDAAGQALAAARTEVDQAVAERDEAVRQLAALRSAVGTAVIGLQSATAELAVPAGDPATAPARRRRTRRTASPTPPETGGSGGGST
jgi:hypothetical protein